MEKFMLIFHGGISPSESPAQLQSNMEKWIAWVEKLRKGNKYLSGEPLLPGGKLISGANGKSVTDGPYTEGKEVVGGYFIVEAANYNEAVTMCNDYPDYQYGGKIQIRQVMKMDNM
jgi:hypothetical protein